MRHARRRSAFILLIVVSMTSMLSVLAVTFAMTASLERNVSANYVDQVRARMLATAGIEAAMVRLRADATQRMYNSPTDPWTYIGTWVGGVPQPETPLELADVPSYQAGLLSVDWQTRGYSGALPGTYTDLGDTFALRITDLGDGLDINGRETHLAEMLDALGRGIRRLDDRPDPIRGRGAAIVALRETTFGGRFKSFTDLEAVLLRSEVDLLRSYLTLRSWNDPSVIEPRPQDPATWPEEHYDFEPPAGYPGRHPVNVNTAPLPVLFACVLGLSARVQKSDGMLDIPPITEGQAQSVARQMGAARQSSPFTTWDTFEDWCETSLTSISRDQRCVLLANANPNTRLNKFVPDGTEKTSGLSNVRPSDKTDLTYHTTEFTFWDLGWFEVESVGRVLDAQHRLVADAKLGAIVKLFDLARHSTQRDFVAAALRPEADMGVRTFPESMADQDAGRASAIDGRVLPREDDALDGDEVFWLDNDDTLAFRSRTGEVHGRWYTNVYDQNRRTGRGDLLENLPADQGLPNVPRADPVDPSLMNGHLVPALRNSTWGSGLMPDGQIASSQRGRVALYPGVDRRSGVPFVSPRDATIQFWLRQDPRAGKPGGLYAHVVPGARQPIPAGPGPGHDLYGLFIDSSWVNGGHGSLLTGGLVLPQCRRAPVDYPFAQDYLWLGLNAFANLLPLPGYWAQVRMEIQDYTTLRLYLNGRNVSTSTAWFDDVTFNTTNILDMTQFGQVYLHSYDAGVDWLDWSEGKVDTVRVYDRAGAGLGHPWRFPVSNGGTSYEGAFTFGARPVRVLGVGFSQIRPRFVATGNGLVPISDPPRIALEVRAEGGTWLPAGNIGDGAPLDLTILAGQRLEYRARFYDNGLSPNNAVAYLDDVTVLYSSMGPEIRGWILESP